MKRKPSFVAYSFGFYLLRNASLLDETPSESVRNYIRKLIKTVKRHPHFQHSKFYDVCGVKIPSIRQQVMLTV